MSHNAPPREAHTQAFALYCQGHKQKVIAQMLGVSEKSIGKWKYKEQWTSARSQIARSQVVLPADAPSWAYRLLLLLVEQQNTIQALDNQLTALSTSLTSPI